MSHVKIYSNPCDMQCSSSSAKQGEKGLGEMMGFSTHNNDERSCTNFKVKTDLFF